MRYLKAALLLLLLASFGLMLHGQNTKTKSTKDYSVSYPADWEAPEMDLDLGVFTAVAKSNSMIPLTLAITVEEMDEEDLGKELTELAEGMIELSGAEIEMMGLEPDIDIELAEETRLNGIPCYHYIMNVGIMGMTTHTENYLFLKDNKLITMSILGDEEEFEEQAEQILGIFKSFKLTK